MKMNKQYLNEDGLTLVELLAGLAIGSFIMILIMSMLLSVQKQYSSQSNKINHLTDITLATKTITKDLRSAQSVEIINNSKMIIFMADDEEDITYELVDDVLKKKGKNYVYEISEFIVSKDRSKITLLIESNSKKRVETEIVMREVDGNEQAEEES